MVVWGSDIGSQRGPQRSAGRKLIWSIRILKYGFRCYHSTDFVTVTFINFAVSVRPYLDSLTACTIATSIVHSKLDCCILPKSQLSRLQQIQSSLARSSLARTAVARPPSSSTLKITDRSIRYALPCLWNQLPLSLRQPLSGTSSSISDSPILSPIISSSSDSPLCSSITPSLSLFHSRLKTYLFHKSYPLPPYSFTASSRTATTDYWPYRFFWATRFLFIFFLIFRFCGVR